MQFFLDLSVATLTVDLTAIVMTLIMIYHIKSKYTAVGKQVLIMTSIADIYSFLRSKGNGLVLLLLLT